MPLMNELALPLTHDLRLSAFFEEEIHERHIQRGGDAFERLQGRHRLAVFELTDKARGDPGMFGESNGRQPPHLPHMANLLPQIHGLSLSPLPLSRTRGRRGEGAKKPAIFPPPRSPSLTGKGCALRRRSRARGC